MKGKEPYTDEAGKPNCINHYRIKVRYLFGSDIKGALLHDFSIMPTGKINNFPTGLITE